MKKQYGSIFAALFLCIAMNAQDFQPMEYNGLLYQELACNVADKEDAALVVYLHGRHASGSDNRRQLSQAGVQNLYLRRLETAEGQSQTVHGRLHRFRSAAASISL